MNKSPERCSVVIVGAGASGLYCTHLLSQQQDDIVVLEARNRVGGRILSQTHSLPTIEGGGAQNVVIDHGAAWVHGTGYDWGVYGDETDSIPESNPMMELLVQAGGITDLYENHLNPVCKRGNPWVRPKFVLHDANDIALYVAGKRLDKNDPVIEKALERHFEVLQNVSDYGNTLFDEGRGMETVYKSLKETIEQVKESLPLENGHGDSDRIEALTKWYQYLMEAWYGGQASDMQLFEFTREPHEQIAHDERYCAEGDFYGPHCLLHDGMKSVLEPLLANGGADRVRCGQEVVRIQDTKDNTVMVETREGLVLEADCCVVSIPVGCLKEKSSLFQPSLSPEKLEAIDALRMGMYKKVLLTFDRIFWPANEVMIGMVREVKVNGNHSNQIGTELLFDNLWARNGIPCIEAILLGDAASWATGKDTDTIYDAVLEFMKDAMGMENDLKEWCTGPCHVTRWEEDEFSRGAFSCYQLGTRERHTEALRQSEWNGKLVFAGEACVSEYEGSVHAALISARNAVKEVQHCLDKTSSES